jgi:hypothetical protein
MKIAIVLELKRKYKIPGCFRLYFKRQIIWIRTILAYYQMSNNGWMFLRTVCRSETWRRLSSHEELPVAEFGNMEKERNLPRE